MPYCQWCRTFIQRTQLRWRCSLCKTIFCEPCSLGPLRGDCPFCKREGESGTLKRELPTSY